MHGRVRARARLYRYACVRACVRTCGARGRLLIDIRAPAVFVWLNARRVKTIGEPGKSIGRLRERLNWETRCRAAGSGGMSSDRARSLLSSKLFSSPTYASCAYCSASPDLNSVDLSDSVTVIPDARFRSFLPSLRADESSCPTFGTRLLFGTKRFQRVIISFLNSLPFQTPYE